MQPESFSMAVPATAALTTLVEPTSNPSARGGGGVQQPVVRPTEAQLRWAQFHHRSRAVRIRKATEQLWLQPATTREVEGATSDDGNSSSEDEQQLPRKKPVISRGRRALLKVSKRATAARQREIRLHGFGVMGRGSTPIDSDRLAAIFAEDAKRPRRQRLALSAADEEERVRRFEEAFQSLLLSMAAGVQEETTIAAPTKKWTRKGPLQQTVDGRDYLDLKWGVVRAEANKSKGPVLQDRGASWLVHMPSTASMTRDEKKSDSGGTETGDSLVQKHLEAVTQRYLAGVTATDEDDESMSHTQARLVGTGFVKRFVAQMEAAAQHEPLIQADGKLHKPTFAKLVLRYLGQATRRQAALQDLKSPLALAKARQTAAGKNGVRDASEELDDDKENASLEDQLAASTGLVRLFIQQMEQGAEEESIVDADGKLNTAVFEKLVTRYLAQAAGQAQEAAAAASHLTPIKAGYEVDMASPAGESDFFSQLRHDEDEQPEQVPSASQVQRTLSTVSGLSSDDGALDRNPLSPPRGDLKKKKIPTEATIPETERVNDGGSEAAHSFVGSVSNKVGGWFKMLSVRTKEDDSSELEAVAAFRKTQNERVKKDDSSSHSSFRVLPDGIKRAVQSFRGSKLSPKNEGDEDADSETLEEMEHADFLPHDDEVSYSTASASQHGFDSEEIRILQQKAMAKSLDPNRSIIDTDGSEASGGGMDAQVVASLLLSPTLLTKRHQQAIRAVENRSWEQVAYLISANPWLAEMTDVTTNQYILHRVALFGAGEADLDPLTGAVVSIRHLPAPDDINLDLVRMFPAAVHKFDDDGNLPLHMAAASGNVSMMKLLGDRFPSGASVRNNDGMLPLQLAILACAAPISAIEDFRAPEFVKALLAYFPTAVAVADNEGNLPIHTAASVLCGDIGVDVIYALLDEADRQLMNPSGVRFRNKVKLEDADDLTVGTETTAPTDSADTFDDGLQCTMVRNEKGETPLLSAIYARSGYEVIEALARAKGGVKAALSVDFEMNNALHLLVSEHYKDPAAALSILKVAPEAASAKNDDGMLPVEMLPREVILALVLVDLPINLDSPTNDFVTNTHLGASWWYLTCDCDDHYVDVVEEVVSLCSHGQVRAMCFVKNDAEDTLLSRATPKSRKVLQRALRFVGRYEFVGSSALFSDDKLGLKVFDSLDYGEEDLGLTEGKKVLLKCYATEEAFMKETAVLRSYQLDFDMVEESQTFTVGCDYLGRPQEEGLQQYFVSVERPYLSLNGVLQGMLSSEECQTDPDVRKRYATKVFAVLRKVAKGLRHLHGLGLVHGSVGLETCCKYGNKWKLADVLGSQKCETPFETWRFASNAPPEAIEPSQNDGTGHEAAFRADLVCRPSLDSWAFGKVAYEVLVGKPLVAIDHDKGLRNDHKALMDVLHWNDFNLDEVRQNLWKVGVSAGSAEWIACCLLIEPERRPSMDDILNDPSWRDLRRQPV